MGLLSGDFIFVGDVGRPDLLERAANVANTMDGLARQLYASIQRAKSLPAYLQIWPGHGAGSACGKALGDVPSSTLGYERLVNWGFRSTNEDAFVREALDGQPEPPKYFARMKTINRDGPKPRIEPSRIARMSPTELTKAVDEGALVVDVRSTSDYAVAHMADTLNIPTGTSFPNWLGSLVQSRAADHLSSSAATTRALDAPCAARRWWGWTASSAGADRKSFSTGLRQGGGC